MNRSMRTLASLGLMVGIGTALVLTTEIASAQYVAPSGHNGPTTPDHDLWNGRIGLGWFGSRVIPFGAPTFAGLTTPLVGVRYWINPMVGNDGAVGFMTHSGSHTQTAAGGTSQDTTDPSATSFALHLGIPVAIFNMTHYSFQITPELDFGLGTGSNNLAAPAVSTDYSGLLFQVGARAGAEIYFGFIGLPQLAVDASVGLFLAAGSHKETTGNASTKASTLDIGTAQFNSPWDIFRENIAARYYF